MRDENTTAGGATPEDVANAAPTDAEEISTTAIFLARGLPRKPKMPFTLSFYPTYYTRTAFILRMPAATASSFCILNLFPPSCISDVFET